MKGPLFKKKCRDPFILRGFVPSLYDICPVILVKNLK